MPEQEEPSIKVLADRHSDFPISVSFDWLTAAAVLVSVLVFLLALRWLRARRRR